jgi:hypothetical protein
MHFYRDAEQPVRQTLTFAPVLCIGLFVFVILFQTRIN